MERLKQRAENLSQNIDRNDLAKAIANNTNMSKAEADKTVEQYMNLIDNARIEAGKQMDNLEVNLQKAVQEWKEIKHKALVAADKATDAAARSALISFFAILFGAVLCCATGAYGSRKHRKESISDNWKELGRISLIVLSELSLCVLARLLLKKIPVCLVHRSSQENRKD